MSKENSEQGGKGNSGLNRLKELLDERSISARIIGVCLNIHKGTLSNWNTNSTQPDLEDVDKIADLLEVDNHQVINNTQRVNTGLAEAVVEEYKHLTKDKKMPLYVQQKDAKNKLKKVYNPQLTEALQDFITKYKEKNIK